ncbi:effector-associated constant component EACC1 [Microbispora sp. H10830]|uniref:effector-associated constant component EACC1 n=1 Tax=Microbispora sp. H10830 TaxID=2729109 RepID=UPI0016027B06|nr:hypothetical protein [Microbispora sp. H10830]
MKIDIRLTGDYTEQELKSLYNWLRDSPEVRHQAEIELVPKALEQGAMGDTLDLISLVVASALQVPGIAGAIAAWRQTRRQRPPLVIESGDIKVVLGEADPEVAEKIVKALQERE